MLIASSRVDDGMLSRIKTKRARAARNSGQRGAEAVFCSIGTLLRVDGCLNCLRNDCDVFKMIPKMEK